MKWIICTKMKGAVGQEMTGPFDDYNSAMDHFVTMGPASVYEHKYIVELFTVEERSRISADDDVEEVDSLARGGEPADIEKVPAEWREELMAELMQEAADMSSKELAFLLLEGMDMAELLERVEDLKRDSPDGAVTHH